MTDKANAATAAAHTSAHGTQSTRDLVVAVWPCEHGGIVVEPGPAMPGYACSTCGATAATYVLLGGEDFDRWALVEAAEIKRLRAALGSIASGQWNAEGAQMVARTALEGGEHA